MTRSIVVVGASMAGLRTAEQLRAAGWTEHLVVVGDEPHMPYNRPPLSKEALSLPVESTVEDWHAATAFRLKRSAADVEWRLGNPATGVDLAARTVTLADGDVLPYDGLVVATGLRPRRLPLRGGDDRRFVIRTIDDALALRRSLKPGLTVGVVGGGFIGCEVAAALSATDHRVVVVEPMGTILERALGSDVGASIEAHHRDRTGVEIRTGVGVETLTPTADGIDLGLSDRSTVSVDLVVESVGALPNTQWLAGHDLDLSDGVLTDNHLQVPGHPEIVAVGDVARFPHPRLGGVARRIEHWCVPTDTAKRAARSLVDHLDGRDRADTEFEPLLSFWSDQGELRLQSFGSPALSERHEVVEGDLHDPAAGLVVDYSTEGRLTGVLLVNIPPARHAAHRARVEDGFLPAPSTEGA